MLTCEHFKELARIAGLIMDPWDRDTVTGELGLMCAEDNPHFSPETFRAAIEQEHDNHRRALRVASKEQDQ